MSTALLLFVVMDSLGSISIFITLLRHLPPKRRHLVILREMVLALITILLFLYKGKALLDCLGISLTSLAISGGLILFIIALRMIFSQENGILGTISQQEPLLVPMAIPLIAGPSILSMIITLTMRHPNDTISIIIALLLAWVASTLVLLCSDKCSVWLGSKGINALERLTGLILLMLSVQMLLDGFYSYFNK